jgi:selenocysteine lyase/cysteine desulfurase
MFEVWERDHAAVHGLGAAIDYALEWGLPAIEARVTALAATLRDALREIPRVHVHDQGVRQCGIVTFSVDGVPAPEVKRRLAEKKINTSVVTAVSAQYDFTGRGLPELSRASVHYFNTEDEIALLAGEVAKLA